MFSVFGNLLCCFCYCVGPNLPLRRQLLPAPASNIAEICSLPAATALCAAREEKHLLDRLSAGQGFVTRHTTPTVFTLAAQLLFFFFIKKPQTFCTKGSQRKWL